MSRAKPITRRTLLSRRDALTDEERAAASSRVCARAHGELGGRSTVAIYATKGSEVDTRALDEALRASGATVAYPRIVSGERVLAFHASRVDALVPAALGLREPPEIAPAIALSEIDAFCVPGVAFDREGWRIGWGRGHYDATLAQAPRALRLGLAFDCQIVDEIAHDSHDIRLQLVVTESATYRSP